MIIKFTFYYETILSIHKHEKYHYTQSFLVETTIAQIVA